jgi:hypothetical protein
LPVLISCGLQQSRLWIDLYKTLYNCAFAVAGLDSAGENLLNAKRDYSETKTTMQLQIVNWRQNYYKFLSVFERKLC